MALALLLAARPDAGVAQIPGTTGAALPVPINGSVKLQLSTKKPIKLVKVAKDNILAVKTVNGDPTAVWLTGQEAGQTTVELTGEDDKAEHFDVVVQLDIEYLRTQLKRALPTANIEPIPISGNTVVLNGVVQRAQDADLVLNIARSAGNGINLINNLRVAGVQQVQLCVTVASVSRTEFRRMAFNFLTDSKNFFLGSTVGQAVANPTTVGVGGVFSVSPALIGTPGLPNGAPTNVLFGIIHSKWGFLGFLQALRDEAVVKSLAEPTVTTLSGRPASFLVGGEQAIPVPAGLGQVGVQFEEFGTRLNFLPIVLGNGKIHLEVEPEVSALDAAAGTTIQGTVVPGRVTQRVNTTVELEDGQTFVIGGLIEHRVTGATEKTPILGDLPFLGAAFSTKSYQEEEQEVVILVTPHLVDAEDCSQVATILPGQETRTPDDFELFLEGILEAPRGPRDVFPGKHYVPAFKNGPTNDLFPCAGKAGCGAHGACGNGGCANGGCANGGCANGGHSIVAAPLAPTYGSAPAMPPAPPLAVDSVKPADLPPDVAPAGAPAGPGDK
jgi:pilus assembly protein CpaC